MTDTSETRLFQEIHHDLPRHGPGNAASTQRAFSMLNGLPDKPNILDIGCGPGIQTLQLSEITNGSITAVDIHEPFLISLNEKAKSNGSSKRIKTTRASMFDLPFEPASFDLIWAEGAIFIIGLQEGLTQWKRFLTDNGYFAVTHLCWIKDNYPDEIKNFWQENFPTMITVESNLKIIENAGYKIINHFTLPETAWWNDYYTPMESSLTTLRQKYKDNAAAQNIISSSQQEIDMYRKYSAYYGYEFFITRKA